MVVSPSAQEEQGLIMGETRSGGGRGGGKKAKAKGKNKAPTGVTETHAPEPQVAATAVSGGAKKGKKTVAKAASVEQQKKPQRQLPVVPPAPKEEASPSPGKAKKRRVRKHKTGRTRAAATEKNEKSEETAEVHEEVVMKAFQKTKQATIKTAPPVVAESPVADVPLTRSAKKRLKKLARAGSITREADLAQDQEEKSSRQVVVGPELPKSGRVTRASLAAAAAVSSSAPSVTPSESLPQQEQPSKKKKKKSKRARDGSHDESNVKQESTVGVENNNEQPSEPRQKRARGVGTTQESAPKPSLTSTGPTQPVRRIISLAKVKASTPPPVVPNDQESDDKKDEAAKQAGMATPSSSEDRTTDTEANVSVGGLESAGESTNENAIYAKVATQETTPTQELKDSDAEEKNEKEAEMNIDEEQMEEGEGEVIVDEQQMTDELSGEDEDNMEASPELVTESLFDGNMAHNELFPDSIDEEMKSDSGNTHDSGVYRTDATGDDQSEIEANEPIDESNVVNSDEAVNDSSIDIVSNEMTNADSEATDSDVEGTVESPDETGGFVLSPEVASLEPSEASADEMSTVILLSSDTESENNDGSIQEDDETRRDEEQTDEDGSHHLDTDEDEADRTENMYWAGERQGNEAEIDDEVAQGAYDDGRRSYWGELSSVESVMGSDSVQWSHRDDASQLSDEEADAYSEAATSMNQSTHTEEDNDRASIDSGDDQTTTSVMEATEVQPDTALTEDMAAEPTVAVSSETAESPDDAEVQRVLFKDEDERNKEPTPSGDAFAQTHNDKPKAEEKQGQSATPVQQFYETPQKSQPLGLPPISGHKYATTPSKHLLESVLASSPTTTVASITEGLVTPPVPSRKRSFDHAWGPSFGVDESSNIEDAVKDEVGVSQTDASPLSSWFFSKGPANFKKRVVIPRSKDPTTTKALFQGASPVSPRQLVTSPRPVKKARVDNEIDCREDSQLSGVEQFIQGLVEKSSWRSWYRKDEPDQLLDPPLPTAMLRRLGGEAAVAMFAEDSLQSDVSVWPSESVEEEEADSQAEAPSQRKTPSALMRLEAAIRAEKARAKAFDKELLELLQGKTLSGKPLGDEYASLLPTPSNN